MNEPTHKPITLDVYDISGAKVATRELQPAVFGVPMKEGLVHLAVVAQAANARTVHASTKTRGEVRGGGKKPWKQKGTGRARHGSIRSPLWRKGGITFGPRTDRNYSLKINKKARQKAMCMVLSQKVREGRLLLMDDFSNTTGKTKEALGVLQKLPIQQQNKKTPKVGVISPLGATLLNRSLRNIPTVHILPAASLNVASALNMRYLVMPLKSLEQIEQRFGTST
ncbi:MAG: 50S ribosomal protein L4 [Patescibacteria group bacterium]